jgi:nucleotidyltransferase AbiEii toxin of type IV toxin-antitoxin system
MQALAFWKAVTVDRSNLLERFLSLLQTHHVQFCLIGGQAVNAYVEPVVSLDLDIVIASDRLAEVETLLTSPFRVERFEHSVNVSAPGSDLRIQIQLDPRYRSFIERATMHDVLGLPLPVASVEDVLQGKIWAAQDSTRRASKRQKDLADIARLLEASPGLRSQVPADVLSKLV